MIHSFELEKGRIFVGGLHWQALSGSPSEAKAEAQQLAKQLSFDLAVWRTTGAPQIGFASTADGYKTGMLSAAAVVSKTIEVELGERDFLCATELPDGRYLYVSQADGVIPPEGDFIGTAEAVRARMLEDMAIGKAWSLVIAPDMWGMPEAKERAFEDFIPRRGGKPYFKHKWWALKPVKPNIGSMIKTVLPLVAIGGVIALGVLGYRQWQQDQAAKEAARLAMLQSAEQQPEALPHPWKTQQRAQLTVAACATGFDSIPTMWPGNWKPDSVSCSPAAGLVVTWKRGEHGWIKHLLDIEPKASISADGTMATMILPIQLTGGEDEALQDERTRALHLQMTAQQYGLTVSLSAPAAPPPMPGAPSNQLPPQWRELSWAVKGSALSPESVVAVLDGAGFRVGSVVARFSDGIIKWDLEGSQYVLP